MPRRLALRVLDGERADDIPPVSSEAKPLFNWQQMQRWNVSESSLPEGSEIRFREPTLPSSNIAGRAWRFSPRCCSRPG